MATMDVAAGYYIRLSVVPVPLISGVWAAGVRVGNSAAASQSRTAWGCGGKER
jgi:hypothetical protein